MLEHVTQMLQVVEMDIIKETKSHLKPDSSIHKLQGFL